MPFYCYRYKKDDTIYCIIICPLLFPISIGESVKDHICATCGGYGDIYFTVDEPDERYSHSLCYNCLGSGMERQKKMIAAPNVEQAMGSAIAALDRMGT